MPTKKQKQQNQIETLEPKSESLQLNKYIAFDSKAKLSEIQKSEGEEWLGHIPKELKIEEIAST